MTSLVAPDFNRPWAHKNWVRVERDWSCLDCIRAFGFFPSLHHGAAVRFCSEGVTTPPSTTTRKMNARCYSGVIGSCTCLWCGHWSRPSRGPIFKRGRAARLNQIDFTLKLVMSLWTRVININLHFYKMDRLIGRPATASNRSWPAADGALNGTFITAVRMRCCSYEINGIVCWHLAWVVEHCPGRQRRKIATAVV